MPPFWSLSKFCFLRYNGMALFVTARKAYQVSGLKLQSSSDAPSVATETKLSVPCLRLTCLLLKKLVRLEIVGRSEPSLVVIRCWQGAFLDKLSRKFDVSSYW